MESNTYLVFKGDCQEASSFYERCLGSKTEVMMTHAGTPAEAYVPAEWRN